MPPRAAHSSAAKGAGGRASPAFEGAAEGSKVGEAEAEGDLGQR